MLLRKTAFLTLLLFLISALPAFASITIKNNTNYRVDIVIRDTRRQISYSLNPDERETFNVSKNGGQLILFKKQEEQAKKSFDDGDKFIIKFEEDKFVIQKVRDF